MTGDSEERIESRIFKGLRSFTGFGMTRKRFCQGFFTFQAIYHAEKKIVRVGSGRKQAANLPMALNKASVNPFY